MGRSFGFLDFSMVLNRLEMALQHLFNARVTKVAEFLRPTSPLWP
jgi:hypothetical protein